MGVLIAQETAKLVQVVNALHTKRLNRVHEWLSAFSNG
jgi:hypothetical protein